MAATIKDVALAAGVSTATVSRFLIGERVRSVARVRQAVETLDYRPAHAAQSLRSGVHYSVAMIVPDITNSYFASLAKGVESVFRATPYRVFLCNTDESPTTEDAVLNDVMHRVDGIILAPAAEREQTTLHLRRKDLPIVMVDRELASKLFDSVLVDNVGGARAAALYLLGLGHREIAIISGPLVNTPGRARYDGFLNTLAEAGLTPPGAFLQVSDFKESGGHDAMLRLLALPQLPTAVFCANNVMTLGCLKALDAMRVSVGRDLSVIGFDDLDLASLLQPPLTVIDRPSEEQGALAGQLLLKRLGAGLQQGPPQRLVLPTQLLTRGSCAPPRHRPLTGPDLAGPGGLRPLANDVSETSPVPRLAKSSARRRRA